MKRTMLLVLLTLAVLTVTANFAFADGEGTSKTDTTDFVWTRQGYFTNEENDFLSVFLSEDKTNPGWAVGLMTGENMYGWFITQEGETLHGNLVADYLEEPPFFVTITEEGETGLQVKLEDGKVLHFVPYEMEEATIFVHINIEGFGHITYAPEGETLQFDDEFPAQSAQINLGKPETYQLAAKPDEGWKFLKWTRNGIDFSIEEQITVELAESADFIAVFGIKGSDETYVDLSTVKTMGELLGLPDYGTSYSEESFVHAFEQDRIIYRAIANLTPETSKALWSLDWEDEEYNKKYKEIVSQLEVIKIENLSEAVPTQEDMDKLIGKTGQELFDDAWHCSGYDLIDMVFYMDHGPFSYLISFDGELEFSENFDEYEALKGLTVKSITYNGFGDITNTEVPLK